MPQGIQETADERELRITKAASQVVKYMRANSTAARAYERETPIYFSKAELIEVADVPAYLWPDVRRAIDRRGGMRLVFRIGKGRGWWLDEAV